MRLCIIRSSTKSRTRDSTYFRRCVFSLEDTKKYIERHEEISSPIWGAFDEQGTLLGWIDFNRGGFSEIAHTAMLGMGVKKEFRGQGIGSALMDACIENAESLGIEKLEA
jgi:GNAT superfamily N-acetyltransferase